MALTQVVVDCSKQQTTVVEMSAEEEAAHIRSQDEAHAVHESLEAENKRIRELVAAHPDSLVQILARRAGLG